MKNKQKRTKNSYLYIIFLALAFIILLGTGAYAYYQTTISGTISGNVAKWSFKANNQTSTFNIDFGSLYPGKSGTYNLELSAEDSELPVAVILMFHSTQRYNADGTRSEQGFIETNILYSNLFLGYVALEDRLDTFNLGINYAGIYGYIMPGEKVIVPIYYDWPYDGYSELSDLENIMATITVIGRQMDMSTQEAVYDSLETFVDENVVSLNCTNGSYPYPNKYGYSCADQELFLVPELEGFFVGESLGSLIINGVSKEIYSYSFIPIFANIRA